MGTVKSCLFKILVPPSFDKRKKLLILEKLNYLLCKALQLASLCTLRQQVGKIEILFQLSDFLPVMHSFYDKI